MLRNTLDGIYFTKLIRCLWFCREIGYTWPFECCENGSRPQLYGGLGHKKYGNYLLDGGIRTPLKKYESQLRTMKFPTEWIKNVPNHQPKKTCHHIMILHRFTEIEPPLWCFNGDGIRIPGQELKHVFEEISSLCH